MYFSKLLVITIDIIIYSLNYRLIINDCLDNGTQIPYIKKALTKGYGIIVLNSNDNYRGDKEITNSGCAEDHAKYVWEEYITNIKANNILIVAHSYGGVLTVMLANKYNKLFEKKVKAVALTDSVHGFSGAKIPKYLKNVSYEQYICQFT